MGRYAQALYVPLENLKTQCEDIGRLMKILIDLDKFKCKGPYKKLLEQLSVVIIKLEKKKCCKVLGRMTESKLNAFYEAYGRRKPRSRFNEARAREFILGVLRYVPAN